MSLMASNAFLPKRVWVTLLTQSSYLPGVLTLAFTLSSHGSLYPLVVLVTPSLPESSLRALELESKHNSQLLIHPTRPLLLPNQQKTTLIASRFEDTWTKLRAFELTSYDACVFLDADITIYKNMDDVFDIALPDGDWIAANHACVCNLDRDSWAPDSWNKDNCAYTPQQHPTALYKSTPIPPTSVPPDTYTLINGGLFLYYPSDSLWESIIHHFMTSPALSTYKFPDQDFLADFFCGRIRSLPWKYNALKTMKQWHPNIWRDEEVRGLHYIVDKPWEKRIASDGIAGHLGRDGITHRWWWKIWKAWRARREGALLGIVDHLVAKPLTEKADRQQCEDNRAKGLPVSIPSDAKGVVETKDKRDWP